MPLEQVRIHLAGVGGAFGGREDLSMQIHGAMLALHNRGMVEADLERWDAADASFREALLLATEAANREMIAKTLVNRSEVLVEHGAFDDAIENLGVLDCFADTAVHHDLLDSRDLVNVLEIELLHQPVANGVLVVVLEAR